MFELTKCRTSSVSLSEIFFGTFGGDLHVYSNDTLQVTTVASIGQPIFGIAYDDVAKQIYWCSASLIYRASPDGRGMETVFNATQCKHLLFHSRYSHFHSYCC